MKNSTITTTVLLLGSLFAGACSPLGPIPDRSRFFTLTAASEAEADADTSASAASPRTGSAITSVGEAGTVRTPTIWN